MAELLRRHRFRAMGTDVVVLSDARVVTRGMFLTATERVEAVFAREEMRFSRFRPDSELSQVNARSGGWTRVSADFATLVAFALGAARRTGGRFDPTVLDAVVSAGYDRDFDEVLAGARVALRPARPCGRWVEVELDRDRLRLPEGVGLDLGGVAKGWTVDRAAEAAVRAGLSWALVNAGGDLRLAGEVPTVGMRVGVEDPYDPMQELMQLVLTEGALATSSTSRRAWGSGLHHLIDPTTGAPAATGVVQATAWAPTCAEAEVAATQALLEGAAFLDRSAAVLVTDDDRIVTNLEGAGGLAA